MHHELPRFSVLRECYPGKESMDTKALLDSIGGQVRHTFNDVSATKMKVYLDAVYGGAQLIYDARKEPHRIHLGGRKAVQGIVMFDWLGRIKDFGATGHVDLFMVLDSGAGAKPQFVPACVGHCYWQEDKQPMVAYLWEARP
jgi:hypothetical protein